MHCFTSVVCVYFFKDKDIFDSKKKLKIMSANGLEHKLSSKQQEILEMNKGLFNLFSNQVCIFILLELAYQICSSKSKVQIKLNPSSVFFLFCCFLILVLKCFYVIEISSDSCQQLSLFGMLITRLWNLSFL